MIGRLKILLMSLLLVSLGIFGGCKDNEEDEGSSQPPTSNNWLIGTPIAPLDTNNLPNVDANTTVSINISPVEPLLYTFQTTNGGVVQYFGDKDEEGSHLSVKTVCMTTSSKQKIVIGFDGLSRPIYLSRGDGKLVQFDWNSKTIIEINGTVSRNQASNTVTSQSLLDHQSDRVIDQF